MSATAPAALGRKPRGQALVLLLIVLAILAGIVWWLFTSRAGSDAEARAFAKDAATRLAFQFDGKFLNSHLGREAQVKYPPSFRERLFERLHRLGTPTGSVEVEGDVMFTSHFFQPVGQFRCHIDYPDAPAILSFVVSRPLGRWQLDYLNLTWTPPPGAPPAEGAEMAAPPAR